MAGTRQSGTRAVAPQSGSVSSPLGITRFTQANTLTLIQSNFVGAVGNLGVVGSTGVVVLVRSNSANVGNISNPSGSDPIYPIDQSLFSTTAQRRLAQAYFDGGVGIEKDLAVGGFIYGRIAAANTATTSSNIAVLETNEDQEFYPLFTDAEGLVLQGAQLYADPFDENLDVGGLRYNPYTGKISTDRIAILSSEVSTSPTTGALTVEGGAGVLGDVNIGGAVAIEDSTNSTSIDNGALVVTGGAGIGADINVGGNIYSAGDNTGSIGGQDYAWADAYLNKIYSKFLGSTASNLTIAPGGGMTDVFGDIRVRGQNPIGTAPVVTNTLYVTMDGNDTNDGRAMDAGRACRTIGGAMNSPYYQPGTQILVSAGRYLEDNPLVMKPYTSVRGSDIRTTFIEPINKTQDLFHVNSGCYLNYMNFLNGRSGRLEGQYTEGFNRGAYCAAFPPQTGDNRIDLFQSPYIQNCTNQSGPWLRDGTMFLPNQTVQIPLAIGLSSWGSNTASIVVNVQSGSISIGQSINAGKQTQGFFNARTLLLANKPFIQSQTVAWVDATFNSGSFSYNQIKCYRDTGLIVDAIAQDMLQDSTSDSTFAGLQYWNQGTYTGDIPNEITATIAAITFVKNSAVTLATGAGGAGQGTIVGNNFDIILGILNTGTVGVTDQVISNGLPSTNVNTVAAYNAIISNIETIKDNTINYIDSNNLVPLYSYDQAKCSRDTGLIVDAVAQDVLFGGRSQSAFAGIQYWNQDNYVGTIGSEITTTTNAINYLNSLAQKIVQNDVTGLRYQSTVTQNISLPAATSAEATTLSTDFSVITNILSSGTAGVTDIIVPNSLTASTITNVVNAYNLLQANRNYLKAEVIAFVESTKTPGFVYDQEKCARDVGYMLDSISIDLLYGGNRQAVQSGVYYYGYTGNTAISGQTVQTTAAYNYLKELLYYVVQGIEVPAPFGATPQDTSSVTPGTIQEALVAQGNIDYITSIISGGPGVVEEKTPLGLAESSSENVRNAAAIIHANRAFIQSELIAYINDTFVYGYSQTKCRRDVGYILESVAYDLLHGGNLQSIKSGVYYYDNNSTSTLGSPNEIPATTAAYNFIKSIVPSIVRGDQILSPYQLSVPQVYVGYNAGTNFEIETLQHNIDTITNIIRNGPSVVGERVPINLATNTSTGVLNSYDILMANRTFIQSEVIAFLNQTLNTFNYNRQLCYRDAGILVENMAYDMAFGGNEKSIESGKAYYRGVTSVIAGQEVQTIGAIDYISYLSQLIVQNDTCPILVPPANIPVGTQVINTVLTGGEITTSSIKKLFNITTDIILNGPDTAPELFKGPGPDAAFVSAEVLLQANRSFIQESVIKHINYFLCDPPKSLPYNQIKCRRDTGIIIDSIATDLLFPTPTNSQATFSGIQYFNQGNYVGAIKEQLGPTINAITYLRDLSVKVVQNITTATDALVGITRYTNGIQTTSSNYASSAEIDTIRSEFGNILTILNGKTNGWTDLIVPDTGQESNLPSVKNTVNLLLANTNYIADEVVAFVNATNPGFTYSTSTCARDVGYIIQSICFDLLYGGNRQSIQSGLCYYSNIGAETVIPSETTATVDAFTFLANLASTLVQGQTYYPLQTRVRPVTNLPVSDSLNAQNLINIVNTLTNIIANGPGVASDLVPVSLTMSVSKPTRYAHSILKANRKFMIEETITYLDQTYNPNSFNYNQELCYRDTGLIIDAVSQDILLGGNQKSIEAGLSYWNQGYNYVAGQESTTTAAINYARDLALQVIANTPVTTITGTVSTQIINPFYQYGGDYMPQQAISRNFGIITNIIERGPSVAPPVYAGGGLFALNGINGSSVTIATKVTSVEEVSEGIFKVGLDKPTVGFGDNSTLYFGDTLIYPLQDNQVEELCLDLGLATNTWNERKVDPIGAMGGALIDGAVISDRSPIQSFVFDAYTQLNQGGIGVKVTNNGYSQLVSVFTIFCSIGVLCDNGGIASITNSNCNFGDLSLVAKGYGPRSFSGTVFNPSFRAYPFSPNVPGSAYLDQFYPNGYWPNNGGSVEIFVPDSENRPHIGQVMEVVPPEGHLNEQNFPGFLNVFPSTSTLTTGTINLTNINTTDVYIGNTLRIRDQFGREYDDNGVWYAATGTVVTDVNYNSISLNQALTSGGGDVTNPTFFTLYFCGNSYYTVQTSQIAEGPYAPNTNILSANADPFFEGPATSQVAAHVTTLNYLKSVVDDVIGNIAVTPTAGNTATQVINFTVAGGSNSQAFIDLRFTQMINIINAPNIAVAKTIVPQNAITTSGTIPEGAGSAVTLIENNINFISKEVAAYVTLNLAGGLGSYNQDKCIRDIKLILQQLIYDLQSGGNYNMVFSGLSYWSRPGTYHIVQLGEAVNRPDLFPDGSTVNFYQRSYISASGYLFEYVGAGTNYGALPQRGVADPVQSKETVQLNSGKVFFTSTDQNGDFRIGPGLVISQATGVLSGRTFVQSLYANMTPFILAIT